MGSGIDMARDGAPEHAAILDDFKDQLLLVFIRRAGGKVSIPIAEADSTGGLLCLMSVVDGAFHFELRKKQ
jgi:hypothetical protein